MANVVVESTASASGSSGTLTITKPTGLAVGDLLVFIGSNAIVTASTPTISTKSGWTLAGNVGVTK